MRAARSVAPAAILAMVANSCGGSPASSITAPSAPPSLDLSGTWSGTGLDSQGATMVTWALTQTGNSASGTVTTAAVNPNDGSCNSCHRNKTGTFSGTISGPMGAVTMFFAAGVDGDPTPECTATLTGTASRVDAANLTATYSGSDSCEGPFLNGSLTMARRQ